MNQDRPEKLGFAGYLAKTFLHSKLTPVIAISSLFLGLVAVYLTPKEEEPQISVPMIDIRVASLGLEAPEVEKKVTEPIERSLWGLDGVEYIYSASRAHGSLVTVRFKVGENVELSLVKVHHKLMAIRSQLPNQSQQPEVRSYSIDDVPFLTLTFSSNKINAYELRTLITPLAREFSSTPDLAHIEVKGGQRRTIRVEVDPVRMKQRGVSLLNVIDSLHKNNVSLPVGKNWSSQQVFDIDVGGRYSSVNDLEAISLGQRGGRVITLREVARILDGPEALTRASFLIGRKSVPQEAVSIVFAKRKGTNVTDLSKKLLKRAIVFKSSLPDHVRMTEMRNYGSTAEEKSKDLLEHLLIATLSVAALIAVVMGLRSAWVVAIAIPVTLALTLAIYYFLGYTLNRITLFALIFSIGILVDDAIVVVENIERHMKEKPQDGLLKSIMSGVSEVGNPTILATFTVIAAILPMAFVKGMMGPYMKPIPIGASLAMILSLFVAFIVTPWSFAKIFKNQKTSGHEANQSDSKLDKAYKKIMERLLSRKASTLKFLGLTSMLFFLSLSLLYLKAVKVKMLPFDNKNEFQVLLDYPSSTPLVENIEKSKKLAQTLTQHPEVKNVLVFAGESAPFSFSGMVKHTFLRGEDYQADFQVLLTDKAERTLSSHEIIESLRPAIHQFAMIENAISKVLEIPPGPPVLATMVAEIYGPDQKTRDTAAREIHTLFASEKSVVDLDSTLRPARSRFRYNYDFRRGGALGANAQQFGMLGYGIFSESKVGLLNESSHPEDIDIILSTLNSVRSNAQPFLNQSIPSLESGIVDATSLSQAPVRLETPILYRKNLKPVAYVTSELSGTEEAPVYGILKLAPKIKIPTQTAEVPWNTSHAVLKWDGEWFITYEVFRDLGGAFALVIVLIYVLVLGWFKSYAVPLVIMAPIPISLIGILPGHAALGAYFTATSMIGFIAGAGIIVRNSIILVDFIEHQLQAGMPLKEAVISAGVLRFRPMLLTAAAVVVGSAVMLADPIFQGLAVSLMFGEIAATLLSRFMVPVLYYWTLGTSRQTLFTNQIRSEN